MADGNLLDRIRESLNNLVTLEIVTAVGPVRPAAGTGGTRALANLDLDWDAHPPLMLSRIDLLQGDIRTVMDEEFLTEPYREVREFHMSREREGHALIQRNIASLMELARLARRLAEGETEPPQPTP